jgi:hypothetical protein
MTFASFETSRFHNFSLVQWWMSTYQQTYLTKDVIDTTGTQVIKD